MMDININVDINVELLHWSIDFLIRKFIERKVQSCFLDNTWVVDLSDMQLISECNKDLDFQYLLLIFIASMHRLFL